VFQLLRSSIAGGFIAGNTAQQGGGVAGVFWFDPAAGIGLATLEGVLISGNSAVSGGGLAVLDYFSGQFDLGLQLTSCTVSGNRAGTGGGVYLSSHALLHPGARIRLDADRTVLFGNCANFLGNEVAFADAAGLAVFTCSNVDVLGIEGPGETVFNGPQVAQNPEFCSPTPCSFAPTTTGLYELAGSSPNLPTHNPCMELIGARGEGCAIVGAPREETPAVVAPALAAGRNPFRGSLAIRYQAPEGVQPELRIYDVRGTLVRDLPLAGTRGTATWDGLDRSGAGAPAGVYFLQLVAGPERRSLRVVRLQ
jgi:hypothetical protein